MRHKISKSNFKAHALEVMKDVELTGNEVIVTSNGKPALVVKKFEQQSNSPLQKLRDSVVKYSLPTEPVSE